MSSAPIPTFEELREMFRVTGEQFRETGKKIEELRLAQQETDRQMKETDRQIQATARVVKETNEQIGRLGNRIGDLVEALVAKGIVRVFQELGYAFTRFGPSVKFMIDEKLGVSGEIDLFLENGEVACLMEAKTKLTEEHVEAHAEKMARYRLYADARKDYRKFIAAVGGVVLEENVRNYALKRGFYVVQLSGDNVVVIPPLGKPKEW
jgi:hypothetical protein